MRGEVCRIFFSGGWGADNCYKGRGVMDGWSYSRWNREIVCFFLWVGEEMELGWVCGADLRFEAKGGRLIQIAWWMDDARPEDRDHRGPAGPWRRRTRRPPGAAQ